MQFDGKIAQIQNQHDLSQFVKHLSENLEQHPQDWENHELGRFLEALAAWLDDSDSYFQNMGLVPDAATWKVAASLLLAARGYE